MAYRFNLNYYFKIAVSLLAFALLIPSAYASDRLDKLAKQSIMHHAYPGFCVQVGNKTNALLTRCYGTYQFNGKHHDDVDSEFDLASLTKVVATTTAIMQLVQQHRLTLKDKVVMLLPQFNQGDKKQKKLKSKITVQELLDHSSGLPAEISRPITWQRIYNVKVEDRPGTHYKYSDINFVLLQKIIEKISQQSFEDYCQKEIFNRLFMNKTHFYADHEDEVPTDYLYQVDDPIARSLGGVAGNAGLFSTINDMGKFARMLLSNGRVNHANFIKAHILKKFTTVDHQVLHSTRALGFDTVYDINDKAFNLSNIPHQFSAGQYMDPTAFGHTGYTGTDLWVSPVDHLYIVFLSNRINPATHHFARTDRYWRQQIVNELWQHFGRHHANLTYLEPKSV